MPAEKATREEYFQERVDRLKAQKGEYEPDDIRNLDHAIEILSELKKQLSGGSLEVWRKAAHAVRYLERELAKRLEDPDKEDSSEQ